MDDLRTAHTVLVDIFEAHQEPMPPWSHRDPGKMETCLNCTEVTAFGHAKYPELAQKAAKLFYSGVKLHIFPNGNKRFGLLITVFLLLKNGYRLEAQRGELSRLATEVADSDPHSEAGKPDLVIERLTRFFEERMTPNGSELVQAP